LLEDETVAQSYIGTSDGYYIGNVKLSLKLITKGFSIVHILYGFHSIQLQNRLGVINSFHFWDVVAVTDKKKNKKTSTEPNILIVFLNIGSILLPTKLSRKTSRYLYITIMTQAIYYKAKAVRRKSFGENYTEVE